MLVVVLQKWFTAKKRIPGSTMHKVRCWVASLSIDINVSKPQSCKIIDIEAWFSWLQYNHQIQYGFNVEANIGKACNRIHNSGDSACSHCAPNATSTRDELFLAGVDQGLLASCPLYINGLRMYNMLVRSQRRGSSFNVSAVIPLLVSLLSSGSSVPLSGTWSEPCS